MLWDLQPQGNRSDSQRGLAGLYPTQLGLLCRQIICLPASSMVAFKTLALEFVVVCVQKPDPHLDLSIPQMQRLLESGPLPTHSIFMRDICF